MAEEIEFGVVDFITVGTIGPPGQRVFHLQFGRESDLMTLTLEKEQSAALADSITTMLEEIEERFKVYTAEAIPGKRDMELREPILPAFRIAQMGLGYDVEQDQVVLIMNELQLEDDPAEQRVVRVAASRDLMRALVEQVRDVVAGGRPICGNCGRPIDPDGHFCPKSNGHGRKAVWA